MTNNFSVAGLYVVVVGAARSGVAAAELLARRGARVTVSEVRESVAEADRLRGAGIALELGGHRDETLASADLVVLSPGVSPRLPGIAGARRRGIPIISEVELAARWLQGRIVAVTGTKGKSTTSVLTGRMLDAAGRRTLVGGNVGTALSSQVEASDPDVIHVVEVSSFQLELTDTFHPWIAVLLNLSADHLDRHDGFQEYAEAKARIFANQTSTDTMVINADDPHVLELARRGLARRLLFGVTSRITDGVVVAGDAIVRRSAEGDQALIPLSAVRLPGSHLLSDVVAAAAVGTIGGVSAEAMQRAVASFDGLPHTLEPVGEIASVRFVNDSKATNGPVLAARAIGIVAIGEARARLRDALAGVIEVSEAETMGAAVRTAFALARPGGTVLLAPACASFDMFTDYADRGNQFKKEVTMLADDQTER